MSELVKEFEEFLGRKESEIETLKARVQDLEASYRGAKHDAEYFEGQVAELRVSILEEYDMSQQQIGNFLEQRDALRERVDELEEKLQAYETQFTAQEDGTESLLERLAKQKRDLDYYAERVAELEGNNSALYNRVQELEAQLEEERLIITCGVRMERQTARERDELRKQVDYVHGNNSVLEAKINELNETIELQHRANHQMQVELNKLRPKPPLEVRQRKIFLHDDGYLDMYKAPIDECNVQLFFTDGKLTGAEVIGEKK